MPVPDVHRSGAKHHMSNEIVRRVCASCDQELSPGARHPTPKDCIEALKAALESCAKCGGSVGCLKCGVKRVVRGELNRRAPGVATGLKILGELLRDDD